MTEALYLTLAASMGEHYGKGRSFASQYETAALNAAIVDGVKLPDIRKASVNVAVNRVKALTSIGKDGKAASYDEVKRALKASNSRVGGIVEAWDGFTDSDKADLLSGVLVVSTVYKKLKADERAAEKDAEAEAGATDAPKGEAVAQDTRPLTLAELATTFAARLAAATPAEVMDNDEALAAVLDAIRAAYKANEEIALAEAA